MIKKNEKHDFIFRVLNFCEFPNLQSYTSVFSTF